MSAKKKLREELDAALHAEDRIRRILQMPGFEREALLLKAKSLLASTRPLLDELGSDPSEFEAVRLQAAGNDLGPRIDAFLEELGP